MTAAWPTGSLFLCLLLLAGGCAPAGVQSGMAGPEAAGYRVWVASESVDQVTLVHFDGRVAEVVRRVPVGTMPVEIDGPHGIAAAPKADRIYVTLGHGVRFGWLLALDAATGELAGRTPLGLFPATVSVTPDGDLAFVSNFNLHGDHVPSSISKVDLATMVEVARTETCVMPHGSRVSPDGNRHYSVCMMDDELVEIDVGTGEVSRRLRLVSGMSDHTPAPGASHDGEPICSPTWAEPSVDGTSVFVTCNRAAQVLEVDVESWQVTRSFATGESPYNLAVTPDGRRLLVTLRSRTGPALEIFDPRSGNRIAHIPTSTTLPHGIAVPADSRYAFVSVEGVGSEPGRLDVIDLATAALVTSVGVGQQATGIAVLD